MIEFGKTSGRLEVVTTTLKPLCSEAGSGCE